MGNDSNLMKLLDVCRDRGGVFSLAEAEEAGFRKNHVSRAVSRGTWVPLARGVYRLSIFEAARDEELVVLSLWTRTRGGGADSAQGTFSHTTALSYQNVGVYQMNYPFHMTVPPGFRRNSDPPFQVILHESEIEGETVQHDGFRVSSVLRAIRDVMRDPSHGRNGELVSAVTDGWEERRRKRELISAYGGLTEEEKAYLLGLLRD